MFNVLQPKAIRIKFALAEDSEIKTKSCRESFILSGASLSCTATVVLMSAATVALIILVPNIYDFYRYCDRYCYRLI